uniref:GST C-terminal domain-containing protein n=1 Tax=Nothobranchius furzeri TaxID=105023 RepID=A0A8C6M9A1_NOTFU
ARLGALNLWGPDGGGMLAGHEKFSNRCGRSSQLVPSAAATGNESDQWEWVFVLTSACFAAQSLFYERFVPENERHDSARKRNGEDLKNEIKLWEGYMQNSSGDFLAGKTFSMADVIVFPVIAFLFRFGLNEEHFPKLAAYHELLKNRPSIKASWPPSWKDTPGMLVLKDF